MEIDDAKLLELRNTGFWNLKNLQNALIGNGTSPEIIRSHQIFFQRTFHGDHAAQELDPGTLWTWLFDDSNLDLLGACLRNHICKYIEINAMITWDGCHCAARYEKYTFFTVLESTEVGEKMIGPALHHCCGPVHDERYCHMVQEILEPLPMIICISYGIMADEGEEQKTPSLTVQIKGRRYDLLGLIFQPYQGHFQLMIHKEDGWYTVDSLDGKDKKMETSGELPAQVSHLTFALYEQWMYENPSNHT